jgi:hypothetical protein
MASYTSGVSSQSDLLRAHECVQDLTQPNDLPRNQPGATELCLPCARRPTYTKCLSGGCARGTVALASIDSINCAPVAAIPA